MSQQQSHFSGMEDVVYIFTVICLLTANSEACDEVCGLTANLLVHDTFYMCYNSYIQTLTVFNSIATVIHSFKE